MRVVVVHAHPLPESLSRHFCSVACAALESGGHAVELVDLHQMGFDPRLTTQERADRYGSATPAADVVPLVEQLRRAQAMVLVFPTWWFGMPAILKGYVDRVFAPNVAFANDENFGPIRPLLNGLRHAVVITTLGTPWWVDRIALRRPLRRVLKTAVFGACAPNAKFHYMPFYAAEAPPQARVDAFAGSIRRRLGRLS